MAKKLEPVDEEVTVYITQYALTKGVIRAKGLVINRWFRPYAKDSYRLSLANGYGPKSFATSKEEAEAQILQKIHRKRDWLRKVLRKLDQLERQINDFGLSVEE